MQISCMSSRVLDQVSESLWRIGGSGFFFVMAGVGGNNIVLWSVWCLRGRLDDIHSAFFGAQAWSRRVRGGQLLL